MLLPLISRDRAPQSMIFIDFLWFSLIFVDFHWFSMIFFDFHNWFSLIFANFQWFASIFFVYGFCSPLHTQKSNRSAEIVNNALRCVKCFHVYQNASVWNMYRESWKCVQINQSLWNKNASIKMWLTCATNTSKFIKTYQNNPKDVGMYQNLPRCIKMP